MNFKNMFKPLINIFCFDIDRLKNMFGNFLCGHFDISLALKYRDWKCVVSLRE